jgi:alpha-galactosidase
MDNQPHFVMDGTRVWTARAVNGDAYLALFNTGKAEREVGFKLAPLGLESAEVTDLWTEQALGSHTGSFSATLPSHGAGLYRLRAS